MQIRSDFSCGNIKVLDASDAKNIQLEIVSDFGTSCSQWFYFQITRAQDISCQLNIVNAGAASYVEGWVDYRAVVSTHGDTWTRVDTRFENDALTIKVTPASDSIYVAYFAPYTMERHANLLSWATKTGLAEVESLGATLDGQSLDLLVVDNGDVDSLVFWVTARQHPGEVMAEWWMEGFLERLLDKSDAVAARLRQRARFYMVPNMNPDGSRRGHHRTNAAGVDLNRAWAEPCQEKSPEVYWVRKRMLETQPDFCLDVHGTEVIQHVFIVGPEGPAGVRQPVAGLVEDYKHELLRVNRDFQTVEGFPTPAPEDAEVGIGTNYLAETLKCLCMTLEMPFIDTVNTPDVHYGWSPQRSKLLGQDNIVAMLATSEALRRLDAQ